MEIKGYVDMHSHIIPGVDDGSQSLEDSIQMLKMAYEEGVRTMYATPHFGSGKEHYDAEILRKRFEEVSNAAKDIGEEGITLILGNEVTYSPGAVELINDGTALTMGGSRYVLMEFDYGASFKSIYKGLQQIINAGYRPILAHIERYYCLIKKYDDIASLRELGVALQINAASVIPKLSQEAKFCRKLVREGYIQFLGSDCHSPSWRPPVMKSAIEVLEKKTPEKYMDRILRRNPEKMFNNEFI
jgi:protein-tyrosine phosphatase